jgi:hypothetical protein
MCWAVIVGRCIRLAMRHFLVGATLLFLALAATFGVASILQGYATAPMRMTPAPVAGEPDKPPVNKLSPGEQGRSLGARRAGL